MSDSYTKTGYTGTYNPWPYYWDREPWYSWQMPYRSGWICPKCGRVHAPWVASCPCSWSEVWPTITCQTTTVPKTETSQTVKVNTDTSSTATTSGIDWFNDLVNDLKGQK